MIDSILTSVKKFLGYEEEHTHFDADIIMHINSILAVLTQMGVGPPEGFFISDSSSTWDEFVSDKVILSLTKTFVYHKVKLVFDPPMSSAAVASLEQTIKEFEWRLDSAVNYGKEEIQNE